MTDIITRRSNPLGSRGRGWSLSIIIRVHDWGSGSPKNGGAKGTGQRRAEMGSERVSSKEARHAGGKEEGTGSSGVLEIEIEGGREGGITH